MCIDSQLTCDQSRSFTNLGGATTTDNKGVGSTLNPSFGDASKVWGSSNIWGNGGLPNGFVSRAATRDNSRSRDAISEAEVIEGKTGSGSLVDSSVSDDWSYRPPWGGRQSLPGRSISQARYAETATSQERSASNAGLGQPLSSSKNFSSLASRPPTINLNTTSSVQSRPLYGSMSNGVPGIGSDQPPKVYTKLDRPHDPNVRKPPDSAKGGVWPENISPTSERRPVFAPPYDTRTLSQPTSRDGSQPPRFGDDHPFATRPPSYTRTPQRPTQNSSRAPSISSQSNAVYTLFANPNADQLASQLNQLSMNGDSRPPTSYRPSATSTQTPSSSGGSPFPRSASSGMGSTFNMIGDGEGVDGAGVNYLGLEGILSPQHQTPGLADFAASAYGGRFLPTPTIGDFKQGQPFTNGTISARAYDTPTGPRSPLDWQTSANENMSISRLPNLQDQSAYLDPRMQQMLATQLRGPYMYSPYALTNAVQLSVGAPYVPFMPMTLQSVDPASGIGEPLDPDNMRSSLLWEFKSNTKARRYELKDIYDHIAEFAGDQHGSRFIQTKLETANSDEKDRIFREIQANALPLMTDVFGNYVLQKLFEHGDQTHKKSLAHKMRGQVLDLSLQMYGCRVVQKALDHVLVDQQALLIRELETHVLKCVKDQNGNHVIQKAIERCPSNSIGFIIAAFEGQVQHLSIHPYGCRVIQRCLERCDAPSKAMITGELMNGIQSMISDQYGNYVVQHVVEHDDGEGRRRVLNIVGRGLEAYSKHKFASNVVEKCLERADDGWRRDVIFALANGNQRRGEGEGVLVGLIKDNFGNYVIREFCLC